MEAAVLTMPRHIEQLSVEMPTIGTNDVLVRVAYVGICASDVKYYNEGRILDFTVSFPFILGHEVSGIIVETGSAVPPNRRGEKVAIEPQIPCGVCRQCMSGRYNLCPEMKFLATPPVDGALTEYVAVPSKFAHLVPEGIPAQEAALVEPLSVCMAAARKAGLTPSARVLVTGYGPIGALSARMAAAFGADVTVSEVRTDRLDAASNDGFRVVRSGGMGEQRGEFDVLFEASGSADAVEFGVTSLAPAGSAVLLGFGGRSVEIPSVPFFSREVTITSVFRYVNTWPVVLDLLQTGRVSLDGFRFDVIDLSGVQLAFSELASGKGGKTLVRLSDDFGVANG